MDPGRPRRTLAPVAVTSLVATVSLGLLLVGSAEGWMGPDVDRGGGFCEVDRGGLLRQPVNALTAGASRRCS